MDKENSTSGNKEKSQVLKSKAPLLAGQDNKSGHGESFPNDHLSPPPNPIKPKLRIKRPYGEYQRKRSNSLLSSQTDESTHTVISKRSIQTDMNKVLTKSRGDYLEDQGYLSGSRSLNKLTLTDSSISKNFSKKRPGAKIKNLESVSEVG